MENNNELQLSTNKYTVSVISEIKTLLDSSRKNVATQVNQELLSTYWKLEKLLYVTNKMIKYVQFMGKNFTAAF